MLFRAVTAQAVRNSLRDATGSTRLVLLLVSYRPLAHGPVRKAYSHVEHSAKRSLRPLHSAATLRLLPSDLAGGKAKPREGFRLVAWSTA